MFVKRFKRKCSVRGCKNVANVYLISKRREMGNTIGICTDCLKEAAASIEAYTEPPKAIKKEDKPLFPHPELAVTTSSVAVDDEEPNLNEVIEEVTEQKESVSVAEDSVTNIAEPEKATTSDATKPKTKANNNKKK